MVLKKLRSRVTECGLFTDKRQMLVNTTISSREDRQTDRERET
jgi:hypothetical protein